MNIIHIMQNLSNLNKTLATINVSGSKVASEICGPCCSLNYNSIANHEGFYYNLELFVAFS